MNADFRLVALGVLRQYFASLTLDPESAAEYTPNKVIRQYLRETTLLQSSVDFAAQRCPDFWLALFFGSSFGKHAKHSTLYKHFVTHVITRSGLVIAENSVCSASVYATNQLTSWQVMALFYMSGDPLESIRQAIPATRVQLDTKAQILLPLNMQAFCTRMRKDLDAASYAKHLRSTTLDADYAIISSVSMADISPLYLRQRNALISSAVDGDDDNSNKKDRQRRTVIVGSEARPSRYIVNDKQTPPVPSLPLDVVRWTAVEEQLFLLDANWNAFKMAACLSPDHPAMWTICVYLARLPSPPVSISHARFVTDYMPYFNVSAVVSLPEVAEFADCLRLTDNTVGTWSAAKLVTCLIWMYDPYSIGGYATQALSRYHAKYPRLSPRFISALVPTAVTAN